MHACLNNFFTTPHNQKIDLCCTQSINVLCIVRHVNDDHAVPELRLSVDLNWQVQSQAAETFVVPPNEEWNHYSERLQDTLPNATIIRITRLQNRVIIYYGKDT